MADSIYRNFSVPNPNPSLADDMSLMLRVDTGEDSVTLIDLFDTLQLDARIINGTLFDDSYEGETVVDDDTLTAIDSNSAWSISSSERTHASSPRPHSRGNLVDTFELQVIGSSTLITQIFSYPSRGQELTEHLNRDFYSENQER